MKKWTAGQVIVTIILLICGLIPGILVICHKYGYLAPKWSFGEFAITVILYMLGILPGIICMLVLMSKHGELRKGH